MTSQAGSIDPVNERTSPHFASAALITIDVQEDTLDGRPLEIAGTTDAITRISQLCRAFRAVDRPIVHIVRLYLADGSNAEPCRHELVRGSTPVPQPGTSGRLLAGGILKAKTELDDVLLLRGEVQHIGPNEVAMFKPRWGAFFGTPLDAHLQTLAIDTLVFAGCNFPNCPRTSIYEASERDYRIVLVQDAVSGLYEIGEEEMRNIVVTVLSAAEVVRAATF